MPYILNTPEDEAAMLHAIGVASIEELFSPIPSQMRLKRPLALPPGLGEMELTRLLETLANRNSHAANTVCFLGGGSYDHFIPAVVDALASRGEFYTSYTPYQPEASQGNLQAFFEYQTLVTQLTGMDVSNASLYDGGSACAEAALMALAATGDRRKLVTLASVNPEYRQILHTYMTGLGVEIVTVPCTAGSADLAALEAAVDSDTACVLVQHPNFFGGLEETESIAAIARKAGAIFAVSFDPISLGCLKRPGDYGADIAVAEGQSLGSPMAYGGPYLGIIACRNDFVRRLPGRIAGSTSDRRGQRCFVLTLQTREQHIRREKATSNICTNQGLYALRASIYLATVGPQGLAEVAQLCLQKSHYAADQITRSGGLKMAFDVPYFKEFVVRDTRGALKNRLASALQAGILGGIPLGKWYPEFSDCLLVTVTEQRTKDQIDLLATQLNDLTAKQMASYA